MKFFIIFLAVVAITRAEFTEDEETKWKEFKIQHGKLFLSAGKEKERKVTFLKNAKDVEAHNEAFLSGEVTYVKAIHKYSDITDEAFLARFGGASMPKDAHLIDNKHHLDLRQTPPASLDMRTHVGLGAVRDQAQCGSCWAFSTVATVEYTYWRWTGNTIDLSEQYLVDCVYGTTRSGCNGGWMPTAMEFIAKNGGIPLENSYTYTATYGTCKNSTARAMNLRVDWPWYKFPSDDDSIKKALNNYGVLSVCVDASGWGSYSTGIYQSANYANPGCNHAVALIGYGTDTNGIPYWIIRNSWNTWWGEKGYMRLDARRDANGKIYGGIMIDQNYYSIMY